MSTGNDWQYLSTWTPGCAQTQLSAISGNPPHNAGHVTWTQVGCHALDGSFVNSKQMLADPDAELEDSFSRMIESHGSLHLLLKPMNDA